MALCYIIPDNFGESESDSDE